MEPESQADKKRKVFCSSLWNKFSSSCVFMFCTCLLMILTVCGYVTAALSLHSAVICHSILKTTIFMLCLNNPSPQSKVSYTNGIAPRRASECLLLPHSLRREQLLQQGHAWLYNMLPCTGNRAEIYWGQSRFTSAQALASCSCRLLLITGIFPRKPIPVLTCSFMRSKT